MLDRRTRRVVIFTAGASLFLAIAFAALVIRSTYIDRYYMPGDLGHVRVARSAAATRYPLSVNGYSSDDRDRIRTNNQEPVTPKSGTLKADRPASYFSVSACQRVSFSPRAYLTRAIGLRAGTEAQWGEHNGVTSGLNFLEHLSIVFPRSLFASHPEFFPLVNGKRFDPPKGYEYWNPDLGREDVAVFAAHQAAKYFDEHPEAVSYSLGVNDGLLFGESPEMVKLIQKADTLKSENAQRLTFNAERSRGTGLSVNGDSLSGRDAENPTNNQERITNNSTRSVAWFRQRPDFSRLVFTFMNRAAAELAKSHPDKYLGCLAYYWCENTPGFPVDPHVIPFLTADRSQSYDEGFRREEFRLQRRWAEALRAGSRLSVTGYSGARTGYPGGNAESNAGRVTSDEEHSPNNQERVTNNGGQGDGVRRRLGLYDYLDGYGFLVPRVPIHAFAEHIRHAHEVGFTDYYGESSRNWGLDGPLPWVIAQLLQDPEQDVDVLLDEYYANYFGPAAASMRRFFERCEEIWMQQPGPPYWLKYYRNEAQADLFPPSVRRELRGLLEEAAAAAAGRGGAGLSVNGDSLLRRGAENPTNQERVTNNPTRSVAPHNQQPITNNSSPFTQRVAFVSAAFGVTERFCAFQEVRAELATKTLRGELMGEAGQRLLDEYRAKRSDFIRYTHATTAKWPLAFYPINYDDWLRDDPGFAASRALRAGYPLSGNSYSGRLNGPGRDAARLTGRGSQLSRAEPHEPTNNKQPVTNNPARSAAPNNQQRVTDNSAAREVLPSGALSGPLQPGLRLAGLQFGIDLPKPWLSKVEPMEQGEAFLKADTLKADTLTTDTLTSEGGRQTAEVRADNSQRLTLNAERSRGPGLSVNGDSLLGRGAENPTNNQERVTDNPTRSVPPNNQEQITDNQSPRLLHLSGQENVTMYQWARATAGAQYVVSVQTRGRLSSGDAVMLTLGWLDAKQRPVGRLVVMYLPTGDWPDWVSLCQGTHAPPNAAWAGVAIRVQHHVAGDWVEFRTFSLEEKK